MAKKKKPTPPPAKAKRLLAPKRSRAENANEVVAKPARLIESRRQHAEIYAYRHEVGGNTTNAPLTIDIPIGDGRGDDPRMPAFVGFTAELADETWKDQFAFRIVSLEKDKVRVMISRVDRPLDELGWGANLIVHVMVVVSAAG